LFNQGKTVKHYTPDRWVILTIKTTTDSIDKVFAGWYGGFATGDSWKLSSGITDMSFEQGDRIEFINESGSVYSCYKNRYGMTSNMNSVYRTWLAETDCEITIHDSF